MRRFNKKYVIAAAITGVFCVAAVLGYFSGKPSSNTVDAVSIPVVSEVKEKEAPSSTPTPEKEKSFRTQPNSEQAIEEAWKNFQARFGAHLDPTFTPDHRLVRIRSGEEDGNPAEHFSAGDKSAALARAEAILQQGADLIGLNPQYPVQAKAVRSDEISSQIEWVQTYHGVAIEPFGRITLQLDAQGGVHGLFSSYISDPLIVNDPSLDDSSARRLAISGLHFTPDRPIEAGQLPKGDLILFAQSPQDSSQPVELRYAYRYWISGHEVVVDAAKGEILSEKDRRQN